MSPRAPFHTLTTAETLAAVRATSEGLTRAEAERRLAEYGPNLLDTGRRVSPWPILLSQFKNVLIIILLVATVLSAVLGHEIEAVAIAVIVAFAALLGFAQEFRAERSLDALRQMAAPTATVLRDGEEQDVPARDLVPGDIVLLRAGDRVSADARLLEAVNLQAEESALTGESEAVEKHTDPVPGDDTALGDRRNMVHTGTATTYGRGRAVVVATGMATEFGRIATMLQAVEVGRTPLQENLDRVGHVLARASFVIVAVIVAVGPLRGKSIVEMVIFGIALAVAVVPEALPAVVTISLAIGVQRMVKRHALVRRMLAVETLGATSVICSDKTGTLTKDEMTARRVWVAGESLEIEGAGYEPRGAFSRDGAVAAPSPGVKRLLRAAALASDAQIAHDVQAKRWHVKGDPTEGALVVAAAKAGLSKPALDAEHPRIAEIPFTSESKRMTTLHRTKDGVVAVSKGAPEVVLATCTREAQAAGDVPLDDVARARVAAAARGMAGDAMRVLAVSSKAGATLETAEHEQTFLGLVAMIDPPRPEAAPAVGTCEQAGIRVVMITGDHPLTASAIARELGILKGGRVVTGAELEAMSEEAFERDVDTIDVFARVSPAHKLRVVTALQKRGRIVAMTGDGVNDAPALKKADVGIAMGVSGTAVSREAAAVTLTDDNFASIVAAVEEGRGTFGNIKKYLMYLLSSNVGEIGLMTGASMMGLPLPLSAVQILYVNLLTDGLPALALAVDPFEPDLMRRPPRDPRRGIFTRPVVVLMAIGGLWSTLINLGVFWWALQSGRSLSEAMTLTFVTLVVVQFFKAYNFRSDRSSVLRRPFANKWLNLAVAWQLVLLGASLYVPVLQRLFGTFALTPEDWAIAVILSFSVSPVLELGKLFVRRGWLGDAP
ncbi:MAG: cation-translocating P-type ATPase [bacterium]